MSFATPIALAGLLLLPALALWYAGLQRRRRAAAAAFATPGVQPSVLPSRPGWRRHVPMAVFALALIALILAAARPQATVAVAVERATIVLATDVSGSMQATDVRPSRFAAAQAAAREFVDEVPEGIDVGVIAFNQRPRLLQSPTRDREAVRAAIDRQEISGGTATGDALAAALRAIEAAAPDGVPGRDRLPAAIVLLSDGKSTRGASPITVARQAREAGVTIATVALGTPRGTIRVPRPGGRPGEEVRRVPPDRTTMRQVAEISRGEFFETADADDLRAVYERLGRKLATEEQDREVSAAFAGAGLLLLLGGTAMTLGWFGRLV